ncbi:hypothetical protein BVG16_14620 [Paenibacillus selenitireducens]|uniref:VTT domain-containing protein n=1 Tax=Paenibacillus selenitireducens TaxID=1324314 RepID=A0A1T2XCN6_9BACL|nr:DedA family protein [Paenibacillus selenitireducens]OPA77674.1 hypothetical protein BVG16_14620 [Paenibacillus selenitireducens]
MIQFITDAFSHHGVLVLFFILFLELLGLPLPGELLMSFAGYMVFQGKLHGIPLIIMGSLGVCLGITASYICGYVAGRPFMEKYGKYVHLGPNNLQRNTVWFGTYGNKLLVIAYFIPGIRHVTGYFAGMMKTPFRTFACYAYSGAVLWVSVFVILGKILGPEWEKLHVFFSKYIFGGMVFLGGLIVIIVLLQKLRKKVKPHASSHH